MCSGVFSSSQLVPLAITEIVSVGTGSYLLFKVGTCRAGYLEGYI